jgi:predicted GNAT superfamily acetyltransferase
VSFGGQLSGEGNDEDRVAVDFNKLDYIVAINIRTLETPTDLEAVEGLQRIVWSGDETEIIPVHLLRAVVHNGGLVIGAFSEDQLVGFVFGFPGIDSTPDGPQVIHASHMAGVHPEFRDAGLGYRLKRAQWQMVRRQGIKRITWTFDPLQSRNANLNITKLGAVSNTYIPNYYGEMRDGINIGMPSDRLQVDWWVNSNLPRRRNSISKFCQNQ